MTVWRLIIGAVSIGQNQSFNRWSKAARKAVNQCPAIAEGTEQLYINKIINSYDYCSVDDLSAITLASISFLTSSMSSGSINWEASEFQGPLLYYPIDRLLDQRQYRMGWPEW